MLNFVVDDYDLIRDKITVILLLGSSTFENSLVVEVSAVLLILMYHYHDSLRVYKSIRFLSIYFHCKKKNKTLLQQQTPAKKKFGYKWIIKI
jgi:hypothetical protein